MWQFSAILSRQSREFFRKVSVTARGLTFNRIFVGEFQWNCLGDLPSLKVTVRPSQDKYLVGGFNPFEKY